MDLVVGASNDAVSSLVNKLGSLLAQEYTLIGGVSDDIQYINDKALYSSPMAGEYITK